MRASLRRRLLGGLCAAALAPATAWPQARDKTYRLGVLVSVPVPFIIDPFLAALGRRGWVIGKNLEIESRVTGGDAARAPALVRELLEARADIIVTLTTGNAVAARQVTARVPIVMLGSGYPVEAGLAKSLARPGGNVTGIAVYAGTGLWGKYVSLAHELAPDLRELGVLFDYVASDHELEPLVAEMRAAAGALGLKLRFRRHLSEPDFAVSLAQLEAAPSRVLLVTGGPVHSQPAAIARLREFAQQRRVAIVTDHTATVFPAAGLVAYSSTPGEVTERCAAIIDRILRGANPGDLPIEFPTRFELTVHARNAKAVGFALPRALVARADRVIE